MAQTKTQHDYLKRFGHCPVCDSDDIEGGATDIDGNEACQKVGCNDCSATWIDTYTLSSYTMLYNPTA